MKRFLLGLLVFLGACVTTTTNTPPRVGPYPSVLPTHYLAVWVTDGSGQPVVGAHVAVTRTSEIGDAAPAYPDTNTDGWSGLSVTVGDYQVRVSKDGYSDSMASAAVTQHTDVRLTLASAALLVLTTQGKLFYADGQPWRWKGVSAFGLLNRYAKGEDIQPFLTAYRGYNVLRVWPYVEWGAQGWEPPPVDTLKAFLARVRQAGFYTELTLLTSDEPARLAWAKALVPQLAGTPALIVEIANEPETNKHIDTAALRDVLDASGLLYSSGNYEDSSHAFGRFLTVHTARDGEWPRRAHDLLEWYAGGGPNSPSDPPHHVPIVADEPAKLQDVGGDHQQDWRAYFATCALLGAGATFHSETGKYGQLPTAEEARLAAIALEALNAFPADAPLGAYRRPVESSLRTYVIGDRYMVRVRPTTSMAPEPGWTPLDPQGITWTK